MIQGIAINFAQYTNNIYLNLADKMSNTTYKPLLSFTSNQTKKTKYLVPNTMDKTNEERYLKLTWINNHLNVEVPSGGLIHLGTTDFPFDFYDVVTYQNTSNTNLDPSGLTTIWNGLMQLTASGTGYESPAYTEYTTNDSDTESVYITN
jgi:hypothetical protein